MESSIHISGIYHSFNINREESRIHLAEFLFFGGELYAVNRAALNCASVNCAR
jgi:hypothetical protein